MIFLSLISTYRSTWHYKPSEQHSHLYYENPKSHISSYPNAIRRTDSCIANMNFVIDLDRCLVELVGLSTTPKERVF
jgi:hypothetical protein